jgi:hypothetical protein
MVYKLLYAVQISLDEIFEKIKNYININNIKINYPDSDSDSEIELETDSDSEIESEIESETESETESDIESIDEFYYNKDDNEKIDAIRFLLNNLNLEDITINYNKNNKEEIYIGIEFKNNNNLDIYNNLDEYLETCIKDINEMKSKLSINQNNYDENINKIITNIKPKIYLLNN